MVRAASAEDIPAMTWLCALRWGEQGYREGRITRYLAGKLHPQQALAPRVALIATDGDEVTGFIAGHLTRRFRSTLPQAPQ